MGDTSISNAQVLVLGTQLGDAPPGLGMMGVPGGPPPPGGP